MNLSSVTCPGNGIAHWKHVSLGRPECPLPLAVSTVGIPKRSDLRLLAVAAFHSGDARNRNQSRRRWAGSGAEGTGLCTDATVPAHAPREAVPVPGTGAWSARGRGSDPEELTLRTVFRATGGSAFTTVSCFFSLPTTVGAWDSQAWKSAAGRVFTAAPTPQGAVIATGAREASRPARLSCRPVAEGAWRPGLRVSPQRRVAGPRCAGDAGRKGRIAGPGRVSSPLRRGCEQRQPETCGRSATPALRARGGAR